jgi:DNA polymerase
MIVSDLSQIEPRVLAWLCGNTTLLDMLRGGMSVYEAHARATMGWKGGVLRNENPGMYALAKARILGLGYGAGWEKFIVMAASLAGIDITADDPEWIASVDPFSNVEIKVSGRGQNSRRIVNEFREQNAGIVGLWGTLDGGLRSSVSEDYTVYLPSGRKMTYRNVRCEARIEPDKITKLPRRRTVFTAETDGRRRIYYGGMMTENVTQAVARDVFGTHLLRLEDNGWDSLFSAHDEAVLEVDNSVTVKDVEHEMSHCPEWLPGCPIAAEAKEVPCYCK